MRTLIFLIGGLWVCSHSIYAVDWDVYVAKYKQDKVCAISYTFDDGLAEHYTVVFPELEKRGFKGTFWICGCYIEQGAAAKVPRMTWAQLKDMANKGHEISNHSWSHKKMSRLPLERIKEEIEKNDSAIFANIGIRPVTYCYPYNYKPDTIFQVASKNRVGTRVRQFSMGGWKSSSQRFTKWLEDLIKNEEWGVAMTHGINYGYDAFKSPDLFWEHLDEVKSLSDKIWIATFRQVASYIKEREKIQLKVSGRKDGLVITPELKLDKKLFAESLTMVLKGQKVENVSVIQKRKQLSVGVIGDKIIFDFNPYNGAIKVYLNAK